MKTTNLNKVYSIDLEKQVLKKTISETKHLLRQPPAIAIDYAIFQQVVNQGVKFIQIYGKETKTYFTATVEDFQRYGFTFNRGFGSQIALTLKYWHRSFDSELPIVCRVPSLFDEVV